MAEFNTVWFPLQYRCNNKCGWCYVPPHENSLKGKSFNNKKEKEFINLVSSLGVKKIILIGGEPSIYQGIERVIRRIREEDINVSMVTNGRRLSDPSFVQTVSDAGLNSITISIEGSNPTIHESITKVKGSFHETLEGIDNCIKSSMPTCTETTMCRDNEEDLEALVGLLEGKDLLSRMFNVCGPCVSDIEGSTYTIPLSEGVKLFSRVYTAAEKKNVRLVTPVPVCNFELDLYDKMRKDKAVSHGCHILFGTNFVLDANGDVLPCVHFSGYPILNVYQKGEIMSPDEFRTFWRDPQETNQRFRKVLRRYPSKKCSEGGCWDPCTGGCSVFWLKYDPALEIRGMNRNG